MGLSDLQAGTGTAGFGLTVSGGDIGIAVLEAPTPATGTDTRYWLAVNGSNLAATLSLGGFLTAAVSNVTIEINQAGGTSSASGAAAPLDWTADLDLNGDGVFGGPGDTVEPRREPADARIDADHLHRRPPPVQRGLDPAQHR